MVGVSIAATEAYNPFGTSLEFDNQNGNFTNSDGKAISLGGINALGKAGFGRTALAGGSTLARHAFLRSILREIGKAGRGTDGRPDGLLEKIRGFVSTYATSSKRIFYSRDTADKPTGLGAYKMQNKQSQKPQPEQDLRPTDQPGRIHAGGLIVQRSQSNQKVSDDWMQCVQETREMQLSMPEAQATKGKTREEYRAITKALIEAQRPRLEARIKELQAAKG